MPTHLLSQSILRRCFEIMSMSLYKKRCTQTYEDAIEIGALQKNNEVQVESYRTRLLSIERGQEEPCGHDLKLD